MVKVPTDYELWVREQLNSILNDYDNNAQYETIDRLIEFIRNVGEL